MISILEGKKLLEQTKLVELINKKISEHRFEVAGSELGIKKLQEEIKLTKPDLQDLQKLAILKDKIIFHRASIMTLEDLKKEIENDK